MKQAWTFAAGLIASLAACHAMAADCEADLRTKLEASLGATASQAGLAGALAPLMSKPRYFETACERPQLDHPLYPGVAVRQCTYEHLGLKGWVMLANPSSELASKWIYNACSDQKDVKSCAIRLTAYTWCSNQLSFPVVGNIVEFAGSGRSKDAGGANVAFLHGVMIDRPDWLPERNPIDTETQKKRFLELVASEHAYKGPVSQVSRPSGVRREIYVQYGLASAKLQVGDVGRSCPASARRSEWLDVSRILYNQGWRTTQNPMFEAAAKTLMANEDPGEMNCK